MSSDKQIVANRRNARRSTGPRTLAGKAKVTMNAVKHGFTGRQVVLPNENPDEFESFRTGLFGHLAPLGELEAALVEKLVSDIWRLRRVPILEAALFRRGFQEVVVKQAADACKRYETTEGERLRASLEKTVVSAEDREAHEEAQQRVAQVRAELNDSAFHVTRVLEMFPELLSNLYRHEVALSRSMLRTLHELQRLQAQRAGEHVAPPSVLDVNVDVAKSDLPAEGTNKTDTPLD